MGHVTVLICFQGISAHERSRRSTAPSLHAPRMARPKPMSWRETAEKRQPGCAVSPECHDDDQGNDGALQEALADAGLFGDN